MKRTEPNPFALSAPLTDSKEELRKILFGSRYREQEKEREYLFSLIEEQSRDSRAGVEQWAK